MHLSEVNAASKHEPISYGATLAYQQVASTIPETVPVILESIVTAEFIDDEIEAAHEALATDGPRPRVRKRRSGATARPVRAKFAAPSSGGRTCQEAFLAALACLGGSVTTCRPLARCRALAASAIFRRSLSDALAMASRIAWISSTMGSESDIVYSSTSSRGVHMTGGS
jgi:hypothetical protein